MVGKEGMRQIERRVGRRHLRKKLSATSTVKEGMKERTGIGEIVESEQLRRRKADHRLASFAPGESRDGDDSDGKTSLYDQSSIRRLYTGGERGE
jgi:hypothetical protein